MIIKTKIEDNIGIITINRPESLNAMNQDVILELIDDTEKLISDDNIRVIIITGALGLLGQKHVEVVAKHVPANPHVSVIERVRLGISLRTEATAANDERMEEAKRENNALELFLLLALLDVLRAELAVRSAEVALQVRGGLVSDLDASL